MDKVSLYFLCIVSFLGCNMVDISNNIYHNEHTVVVDMTNSEPVGELSLFYDSVCNPQLIPLSMDSMELVSDIDQLTMYNSKLYFRDNQLKALFCCDSLGKKQFAIKRRGRGPGEYLDLTDFCINYDTLYVLDRLGPKIVCYSATDGRYLKSVEVNDLAGYYALHVANNRLWLLQSVTKTDNNSNVYSLVTMGHNGQIIQKMFPQSLKYTKRLSDYFLDGDIYSHNNDINIIIPMQNSIYGMRGDSIYVKYRFDFADKDIDTFINHMDGVASNEEFDKMCQEHMIISLQGNAVESDTHIIAPVRKGKEAMYLIFDKVNCFCKLYQRTMNGCYYLMGGGSRIYSLGNNRFATVLFPHNFYPFPKPDIFENSSYNLKIVYNQLSKMNIKEDDNPLIMTFTLQ